HSNRAAQADLSQVDLVEHVGVDADLEVDVETGMLEADRDLRGLEDHPVALLGVAEVELNHGSVGWKPLAIDVAGGPDDQQVGIEFLGARLGDRPRRPPLADRLHDRLEVAAGRREAIFERTALRARPTLDHLGPLERAHTVGKDRARDPWEATLQLVEAARAAEHLAHEQKRPTIAEDLAALGDRAILRVAAHRATMVGAPWPQVCHSDWLVRN